MLYGGGVGVFVGLLLMCLHLSVWSSLYVQCCALYRSSWRSAQSVMLCIALNSLVSSASRYRYERMISSGM